MNKLRKDEKNKAKAKQKQSKSKERMMKVRKKIRKLGNNNGRKREIRR